MKKVFLVLFIVSLVFSSLMAQPITEQQKLPLEERVLAFEAAMEKNPSFESDIKALQKDVLLHYQQDAAEDRAIKRAENSVKKFSAYQPLADLVRKTLVAHSYKIPEVTELVFQIVDDVEKRYFGIEFTSEIEEFDKFYEEISSHKDFKHIMEDEIISDIKNTLTNPNYSDNWDEAAINFASYAKSYGFYFTAEESRKIIVYIFDSIVKKYDHTFEERAEDFFRVMGTRPDFKEDLKKLNEGFLNGLSANMGSVITYMTNAEFYNTEILTTIDEILLSEDLDLDDEEFGEYFEAIFQAHKDKNYKSDLPKFDAVFEKVMEYTSKENVKIGVKDFVDYMLNAPGNEERLAVFGANFAEYAATKGFEFTAEEGTRLVKEQLQYFLAN